MLMFAFAVLGSFLEMTSALSCLEEDPSGSAGDRCGVYALSMAVASLGQRVDFGSLSVSITTTGTGATLSQLKQAAIDLGIPAEGYATEEIPRIRRGSAAAIVRLQPPRHDWHFVTVAESTDRFVKIIDFPAEPFWISKETLKEDLRWDGNILILGDRRSGVEFIDQRSRWLDWALWGTCCFIWSFALFGKRAGAFLRRTRPSIRQGFTTIELLVSISVVTILLSLFLPAIQNARDRVRSLDCASRLRQIGLGMHQYLDIHKGTFPVPFTRKMDMTSGRVIDRNLSVHAQLLPFLDQSAIYSQICFDENGDGAKSQPPFSDSNNGILRMRVSTFECPSDEVTEGGTNFRVCFGSSPNFHASAAQKAFLSFGSGKCRLSTVTDGLSNTAYFSERVSGDRNKERYDPTRDVAPGFDVYISPKDQMNACAKTVVSPQSHYSWAGSTWLMTHEKQTSYSHAFPPNSTVPDCNVMVSARSWHLGMVNVLCADGSVRKVANTIDHDLWIAIASPNAGDDTSDF